MKPFHVSSDLSIEMTSLDVSLHHHVQTAEPTSLPFGVQILTEVCLKALTGRAVAHLISRPGLILFFVDNKVPSGF